MHVLQGDGALVATEGEQFNKTPITLGGGSRNSLADPFIRSLRLPIVYSWNESVPLHEFHRDNGQGHECTCVWCYMKGYAVLCLLC